jgi:hypothetical protein
MCGPFIRGIVTLSSCDILLGFLISTGCLLNAERGKLVHVPEETVAKRRRT